MSTSEERKDSGSSSRTAKVKQISFKREQNSSYARKRIGNDRYQCHITSNLVEVSEAILPFEVLGTELHAFTSMFNHEIATNTVSGEMAHTIVNLRTYSIVCKVRKKEER